MSGRCPWADKDPLYFPYHDQEWGVAVHDDRRLFEFLVLEGAQAGLSWDTILKKRTTVRLSMNATPSASRATRNARSPVCWLIQALFGIA